MTTAILEGIKTHSPIRWFGGKSYLSKHIVPLFPEHHCFVDVFGGGGHVTVAKPRSKVEIFNDLDNELIQFLLTLRNDKKKLMEELASMPTSRFLFDQLRCQESPIDSIQRAARWFYLLRQRIIPANGVPSGFRYGKVKNSAVDYVNAVNRLDSFEARFRSVLIENLDYRDLIRRYDGPNVMFFADPPYVKREYMYANSAKFSHVELSEILHNIQGKCMVTYYNDPLIMELYGDFRLHTVEARVGAVVKAELGQKRRTETECFFMNY
jgi:DNA adenine methylase